MVVIPDVDASLIPLPSRRAPLPAAVAPVDGLAAEGLRYERAHPQSVVCMPSRSTILTGQHPSTHGVWMNGVALPPDAPSVAAELRAAGYRDWIVVEQDVLPGLGTPRESAARNRAYLASLGLGMT